MCGRFALHASLEVVAEEWLGSAIPVPEWPARYNVAPGTTVPFFRCTAADEGVASTVCELGYWGFKPPWADDRAPRPINARAENVARSNYFRSSFEKRRCVVPVSGWYEWQRTPSGKQPCYITAADSNQDQALFLAGIFAASDEDSQVAVPWNLAIITEPVTPALAHIHDRQPLVLDPACLTAWLDPTRMDRDDIKQITRRFRPDGLTSWPVPSRVNTSDYDDESLLERI